MKKITFLILLLFRCLSASSQDLADSHPKLREGVIINLYDAFGKNPALRQDFGFSCIVTFKGKNILFDAGGNADIFRHNVETLGIDLRQVDLAVISHGHFDHLNGMDYLLQVNPKVKIYMPYDIFWGAPVPFDAIPGRKLPSGIRCRNTCVISMAPLKIHY